MNQRARSALIRTLQTSLAVSAIGLFIRALPIAAPLLTGAASLAGLRYLAGPPLLPRPRLKPLLTRTAGFVVSALILLAALEGGARLLFAQHPGVERCFMPHPRAGFTLRPGCEGSQRVPISKDFHKDVPIEISSQGWRDREYGAKKPDELRVLVLGDSFVFGFTTRERHSIPKQLETFLRRRFPGKALSVINAGCPGTAPWQQRLMLRERGFPLEPDLVLHGLYPGNDAQETILRKGQLFPAYRPWHRDALFLYLNRDRWSLRAHMWLVSHSRLYNVVRQRWLPARGIMPAANALRFGKPLWEPPLWPPLQRNSVVELDRKQWRPVHRAAFELMLADILGARSDCLSRGIDYAAFICPDPVDAWPKRYPTCIPLSSPEVPVSACEKYAAIYRWRKGIRRTRHRLEENGVEIAGAMDAILSHERRLRLYNALDRHFNEAGNRLVAKALAAYVEDWMTEPVKKAPATEPDGPAPSAKEPAPPPVSP